MGWNCLPLAFSRASGMPYETILNEIGHDGSEIINDLPEPFCRRGFHPNEVIGCLLNYGVSATRFELYPASKPSVMAQIYALEPPVEQFMKLMRSATGVLDCRRSSDGAGHALVFKAGIVSDTSIAFKAESIECIERNGFHPIGLWVVR